MSLTEDIRQIEDVAEAERNRDEHEQKIARERAAASDTRRQHRDGEASENRSDAEQHRPG